MANRDDQIVGVFLADIHGDLDSKGFTKKDLAECNDIVRNYAQKGDPMSRYQIAEVTTFVVDELLKESEDFFRQLAEMKNVANGEKAQFSVAQNDVTAYILAKGGTPLRTKIAKGFVSVDTVEIAARPYMNFQDLAHGRVTMSELAVSAAREINYKKLKYVEDILKAAVKGIGANGYLSTNTFSAEGFNKVLATFRRMSPGKARIVGDIAALDRFDGVINTSYAYAPDTIEGILRNGYVGHYKGVSVFGYENPIVDYSLNPLLSTNMLYMLGGEISPLKIVNEGGVRTMEQQNIDDESFEMVIRQDFGAAYIAGKYPTLGAVEFTA